MTDQHVHTSSEPPAAAGAYKLPELVRLINDELTAGLRLQSEDKSPVEKDEERVDIGRHICVELAGQPLAISLSAVLEAGELQMVQSLPLLQDWLTGITNIRGEIVSVVNLALFLGRTDTPSAGARPFLIVHDDTLKTAVTVDRIIGTRSLYRPFMEQLEQGGKPVLPDGFFAGKAIYEEGGKEKEIHLFDLNTFLSSQKLRDVATA